MLYLKGLNRIAKCCIALGDIVSAEGAVQRADEMEPENPSFDGERQNIETLKHHIEDANKAEEKLDYRRVRSHRK
jgi:hypothetical protein